MLVPVAVGFVRSLEQVVGCVVPLERPRPRLPAGRRLRALVDAARLLHARHVASLRYLREEFKSVHETQ